jgi:hypothetical protein
MYVSFSSCWYFSTGNIVDAGVTCSCDSAGSFRGAASFHVCAIPLLALSLPVKEFFSISVSAPGGKSLMDHGRIDY